jgi:hypothetical protein
MNRSTEMRSTIASRSAILVVALGGLIALILQGYSAGFLSVSADEFAKTLTAAEGLVHPSAWFKGVWMPLHFVFIAGAGVLTNDLLLGSRLVSIGFGMVLVAALCGIGHQFGGNKGAALAAILGATHPLVVLLSGTAMVDICYVATYMLGVRFYLRAAHSERPRRLDFLVACSLLTTACAFHYNAWIAVILLVPFLVRDLYLGRLPRRVVVAGLAIVGSLPLAWVGWNWAQSGDPLAFFTKHSDYSATFWAHLGWHASPWAALISLKDSLLRFTPLVAILTFAAIGTIFSRRSKTGSQLVQWTLLLGFLAALVVLYSRGGRPAAFEPRYILLPSVLMVSIASACLVRLWSAGDRDMRAFVLLLSIAAVVVNVWLCKSAVDFTKQLDHYSYTAEARDVARVMKRHLKAKNSARMMIEIKCWNFLAMPVFLNRVDAIVNDRVVGENPVNPFDHPSVLLGEREDVLARLNAEEVGYVAVASPAIQSHIEPWGFQPFAKVDSYTIYRTPAAAVSQKPGLTRAPGANVRKL